MQFSQEFVEHMKESWRAFFTPGSGLATPALDLVEIYMASVNVINYF